MCVFVKSITDHHYRFQPAIFTKRPWMLGDSDLQERFGWRNVWLQFAGTINSYIHCFHSNLFGVSYLVIDEIVSQARFSDINLHFIIKIKKKCNVRLSFFFFARLKTRRHTMKNYFTIVLGRVETFDELKRGKAALTKVSCNAWATRQRSLRHSWRREEDSDPYLDLYRKECNRTMIRFPNEFSTGRIPRWTNIFFETITCHFHSVSD